MSEARRSPRQGEIPAFWGLLILSLAGLACVGANFVREWQAISAVNVSGLSPKWLTFISGPLLLAGWALAIVLAVRLRRWVWLVICVVTFVAVPVFAIAMLLQGRTLADDASRQASFQTAMANALAEQEAEQPGDGA